MIQDICLTLLCESAMLLSQVHSHDGSFHKDILIRGNVMVTFYSVEVGPTLPSC